MQRWLHEQTVFSFFAQLPLYVKPSLHFVIRRLCKFWVKDTTVTVCKLSCKRDISSCRYYNKGLSTIAFFVWFPPPGWVTRRIVEIPQSTRASIWSSFQFLLQYNSAYKQQRWKLASQHGESYVVSSKLLVDHIQVYGRNSQVLWNGKLGKKKERN